MDLCGWSIVEVGTYIITACLPEMRPLVPFFIPTRLLAKARRLMAIPSTADSNPTRKTPPYDNQTELPTLVTHNSITQGQFKECRPWDGTFQGRTSEERCSEQNEMEGSHKESYKEEVTERINWESDGNLTILVTRTTSVTIDTLGSFERPWEYLGPSVGSPTIGRG